jgi:hypothetical protein
MGFMVIMRLDFPVQDSAAALDVATPIVTSSTPPPLSSSNTLITTTTLQGGDGEPPPNLAEQRLTGGDAGVGGDIVPATVSAAVREQRIKDAYYVLELALR